MKLIIIMAVMCYPVRANQVIIDPPVSGIWDPSCHLVEACDDHKPEPKPPRKQESFEFTNVSAPVLVKHPDNTITIDCNVVEKYCEPRTLTTRWVKVETLGTPEFYKCVNTRMALLTNTPCENGLPETIELGLVSDGTVRWR